VTSADLPLKGLPTLLRAVAKLVTADSTVGQLLGAKPLRAEKTWNAGLGFVFTPAPSLSVTLDGYYIRIKNRIERTGRLFGTGISAILVSCTWLMSGRPESWGAVALFRSDSSRAR